MSGLPTDDALNDLEKAEPNQGEPIPFVVTTDSPDASGQEVDALEYWNRLFGERPELLLSEDALGELDRAPEAAPFAASRWSAAE